MRDDSTTVISKGRGPKHKKIPCASCGKPIFGYSGKTCMDCYNIRRGARDWRCVDCQTPVGWNITRCMACERRRRGCDHYRQLPLVTIPRQRHCLLCGAIELPQTSRYCLRCVARERDRLRALNGGRSHATVACEQCGQEFPANIQALARGNGRFCCQECYLQWRALNMPEVPSKRFLSGRREDLGGRFFRSKWEANWARYLTWLESVGEILGWDYECQEFAFPGIKRGARFYLPDFKVTNRDGSVEFHEVKGYMDQTSQTKLARMARYHPHVVVKIIDREAYTSIAREFRQRLPGWE